MWYFLTVLISKNRTSKTLKRKILFFRNNLAKLLVVYIKKNTYYMFNKLKNCYFNLYIEFIYVFFIHYIRITIVRLLHVYWKNDLPPILLKRFLIVQLLNQNKYKIFFNNDNFTAVTNGQRTFDETCNFPSRNIDSATALSNETKFSFK